jgi:transposase
LRPGAERFLQPGGAVQRRYEALRAYLVDDMPAAEVADRFGYSTASIHQMATMLRSGKIRLLVEQKPGPKGPRKATGRLRERVLELRAARHSVTEIAQALTAAGTPISAQSVWRILDQEGLPRLPQRDDTCRGSPTRLETIQAGPVANWPDQDTDLPCDHAGLLLLLPGIVDLNLHQLIDSCGYPDTSTLSAWHSIGTLLPAKCARRPSPSHRRPDRRPGPGVHPRPDRSAEGHPPGHLLLPGPS